MHDQDPVGKHGQGDTFDPALFRAFQAAKVGTATARQLGALRKYRWFIFDQKAEEALELTFDQLAEQQAWDLVVQGPWYDRAAAAFAARPERDRLKEGIKAAQRKASVLVDLRERRIDEADEWQELIYISRYLVAMSLPYEATAERQIVKSARFGDGRRVHLQLNASIPGIDLPFGSDRTLLHWLLDQIARQIQQAKSDGAGDADLLERARFVRWAKASDYLADMGLAVNSGKNYADLRARFRRLAGLSIGLRVEGPDGETLANIPLIEHAHLPTALDAKAESQGKQLLLEEVEDLTFGVLFSKKLVATLMANAVPFPKEVLRQTRKQSQMQDYWLFLAWRSFGAKKPSLIPWGEVREQLWQQDQTARRIKVRFREAIQALRVIWPELQAQAREDGLWVAPPKHGAQLIGRGGDLKRIANHEPKGSDCTSRHAGDNN